MSQALVNQQTLENRARLDAALDSGRFIELISPVGSGVIAGLKELLASRGESVAEFHLQNGPTVQELLWKKTVSLSSSSGEGVVLTPFAQALADGKAVLVELLGDFRGSPPVEEYRDLFTKIGSALAGNEKSVQINLGDEVRDLELNPEKGRLIVRGYLVPELSPLAELTKD